MIVEKLWGKERWVVNEPEYCMKVLTIEPGFQSSLHYHRIKKETFIVHYGTLRVETVNRSGVVVSEVLKAGMSKTIKPGKPHRFMSDSETDCVFWEVSTHHDDTDVVRIEPSRPYHKGKDEPVVSV